MDNIEKHDAQRGTTPVRIMFALCIARMNLLKTKGIANVIQSFAFCWNFAVPQAHTEISGCVSLSWSKTLNWRMMSENGQKSLLPPARGP